MKKLMDKYSMKKLLDKYLAKLAAKLPATGNREADIRALARDCANEIFRADMSAEPDGISAAWLMQQHSELDAEDAEAYRAFCQAHTITLRDCYGNGEIMWPKWLAFQREVEEVTKLGS